MKSSVSAVAVLILFVLGCKSPPATMKHRPDWIPEPPTDLTIEFYRSHSNPQTADDKMWLYLCELIPEDQRPYRERVQSMLAEITPQLRRYFLTRGFDWERGSGGLETCMMLETDEDHLFVADTADEYEALGAVEHANIIREIIPLAKVRLAKISEADASGKEFDFDDGFWDAYEERWDMACEHFNFYDVIWHDIRENPELYIHQK